jgi:sugar phosphate isomerase/epimerase
MIAATSSFAAAAVAWRGQAEPSFAAPEGKPVRTGLGLVEYCLGNRRRAMKRKEAPADLSEPMTFLDVCHGMGAGGIQMNLGVRDEAYCERLRQQADHYGMYIEGIIRPPSDESDVDRFERQVETAARAGAHAVRTVIIPGRRYEFFDSLEKFREFDARGRRSLELAAPVVEKHQVPLAVENHKDHRIEQRVALLKHIDSEYVGACIDTGNNLALLEDPVELTRALMPWARSVHLKDQAVREYTEGFLLGDVPLGQGCIDLKTIVSMVRRRCERIRFSLELITRDPLKVPCLTQGYWATFPDVPASDLAGTLALVRHRSAENLQQVSALSQEERVALEASNVKRSLEYARDPLGL